MDEVDVKLEQITPDVAKTWLEKNTGNYRNLNPQRIVRYASEMFNGNWDFNGETIKFDRSGKLVDGQHRLHAIVRSGATVPALVVRGIQFDDNIDTGRARGLNSVIAKHGMKNAAKLSPTYRNYKTILSACKNRKWSPLTLSINASVNELLGMHEELNGLLKRCEPFKLFFIDTRLAACLKIFSGIDYELTNRFISALADDAQLEKGDPVLALKTAMTHAVLKAKARPSCKWETAMIIKAWNLYRREQPIGRLMYNVVGNQAEPYPVIL